MRYSPERKEAVLQKMMPPHNRTIILAQITIIFHFENVGPLAPLFLYLASIFQSEYSHPVTALSASANLAKLFLFRSGHGPAAQNFQISDRRCLLFEFEYCHKGKEASLKK